MVDTKITIQTTYNPNEYNDVEIHVFSEYVDRIRVSILLYRHRNTGEWHMEDFEPFDKWLERSSDRRSATDPETTTWRRCAEALIAKQQEIMEQDQVEMEVDHIEEGGDGYYLVTAPSLQGLVAEGETAEEALAIAYSLAPILKEIEPRKDRL